MAYPIPPSLVRKGILTKWAHLIPKAAQLLFDTFSLTRLLQSWWFCYRGNGFAVKVIGCLQRRWVVCRGDRLPADVMGWLQRWWVGCRGDGLAAEAMSWFQRQWVGCRGDGCAAEERAAGKQDSISKGSVPVHLPPHSYKRKQIRSHRSSCGLHHSLRRDSSNPALSIIDQVDTSKLTLDDSFIANGGIWAHPEIYPTYLKHRP